MQAKAVLTANPQKNVPNTAVEKSDKLSSRRMTRLPSALSLSKSIPNEFLA
jgi:hypothetical protein